MTAVRAAAGSAATARVPAPQARRGQPAAAPGGAGRPAQGVQVAVVTLGGVEGAEHGHAGGGADLAQRVHQAGGHPGAACLDRGKRG